MRKFTLNPIVLAMAASMVMPVTAFAQGDDTLEEVVVTGSFRDSLANAINIKKNEKGFVDAIVAFPLAYYIAEIFYVLGLSAVSSIKPSKPLPTLNPVTPNLSISTSIGVSSGVDCAAGTA